MQWHPSRELEILPDGKHFIDFSDEFPLRMICYLFDASHRVTPNYHDYLEISYVFEGVFHVVDESVRVARGDFVLLGTTQMHRLEAVDDQAVKTINVYFLPEFLVPAGSKSTESEYLRLFVTEPSRCAAGFVKGADRDGRILDLLMAMDGEIRAKNGLYQQATKILVLQLLLAVMQSNGIVLPRQRETSYQHSAWTKRMQPVVSHIHTHIAEKITTAELARTAHMSPNYFCRFFKEMSGMTPTSYILRARIDASRRLLLLTDMPITRVAFSVGFQSQSYFDKVFKRLTGTTPRNFRQRYSQ